MAVPAGARKPSDRKKPAQTAAQRRKAEESAGQWFPGNLNGHTVRISHPKTWRASTMQMLRMGDLLGWGEKVVHPDDVKLFREADPNAEEIGLFVADAHEYFGSNQGE